MCDLKPCNNRIPAFKVKIQYGEGSEKEAYKLRVCKECAHKNYGLVVEKFDEMIVTISKI